MTEQPALRVVNGTGPEDAVVRRHRFERAHPEAVILPPAAGRWRVVVPPGLIPGDGTSTTLGAWDLGDLMDQLDAITGRTAAGTGRVRTWTVHCAVLTPAPVRSSVAHGEQQPS